MSNSTANGGRQPPLANNGNARPVTDAQKRKLYSNFLRSLGVQPQDRLPEPAPESRQESRADAQTPPRAPRHETLVDRIRRQTEGGKKATPAKKPRDGYSREFSLENIPYLSTSSPYDRVAVSEAPDLEGIELPPEEEGDVEGAPVPIGREPAPADYAEMTVAEDPCFLETDEEEVREAEFRIGPAPETGGSSEISTTISDAVVRAAMDAHSNGFHPAPAGAAPASASPVKPPRLRSERPTLPPPAPHVSSESTGFPGSPPESGFVEATSSPAGIMREGQPDGVADAVFDAKNRGERMSILMEAAHGTPAEAIETGTGNLGVLALRDYSIVDTRVQNMMSKLPPRFHPTMEEAMEILREGLVGFEPLVEKFIRERRWTRAEEETLKGAYVKTADHLQKLFDRKYDQEAETRIKEWEEYPGKLADAEKKFAFTVLRAKDPRSNYETNVLDAFAKGAMFAYLIQQRPGSFIEAIGHPEISKPYGRLGGAENAGIAVGLGLYPENIQLAFLFRCYEETHILTIANELRDKVIEKPTRPLVGKFEEMVRQDVAEFETAISDTGLSPEKFFEVLNEGHTSETLRSNPALKRLFKHAAKEGLIYNKADDFFDALELINDYMVALRMNPATRDNFLKFYLANYSLGKDSGMFYKMFGMCLFDSIEGLNKKPIAKMAFEKDANPIVRKCFAKRLETLEFEERKTILMAPPEDSGGELDFSGM